MLFILQVSILSEQMSIQGSHFLLYLVIWTLVILLKTTWYLSYQTSLPFRILYLGFLLDRGS